MCFTKMYISYVSKHLTTELCAIAKTRIIIKIAFPVMIGEDSFYSFSLRNTNQIISFIEMYLQATNTVNMRVISKT